MNVRDAADKVQNRMKTDNDALEFDPAIIMIIIEAIQVLLPMFVELCQKDMKDLPETAGRLLSPVSFGERIGKRFARRALIRNIGWEDYRDAGGDEMLDAILKEAAGADPDALEELYRSSFICGGG